MAVQIQLRNDTAANWTSANPTLAAGEMGIETNTLKFKIGNGSTAWTSLAYAPYSALALLTDVQLTSPVANQILFYNGTKWINSAAPASGFAPFLLMGA